MTDPIVRTHRSLVASNIPTLSEGQLGVNIPDKKLYVGPSGGGAGTLLDWLSLAGGTLTGLLILSGDPVADLGAATKQYVDNSSDFVSGDKLIFPQAAAPAGWTKDVVHDNKALRVVSGAGGGSAGATPFTSVFGTGKSTDGHKLTGDESGLRQHNHSASSNRKGQETGGVAGQSGEGFQYLGQTITVNDRGPQNADEEHMHTISNLDMQYVDSIIATKD